MVLGSSSQDVVDTVTVPAKLLSQEQQRRCPDAAPNEQTVRRLFRETEGTAQGAEDVQRRVLAQTRKYFRSAPAYVEHDLHRSRPARTSVDAMDGERAPEQEAPVVGHAKRDKLSGCRARTNLGRDECQRVVGLT
jgi:hypothetical protein